MAFLAPTVIGADPQLPIAALERGMQKDLDTRAGVLIVRRCRLCVLHDGVLRAEVDCAVVGSHAGLNGVAVA